jgi:hypothetical protein
LASLAGSQGDDVKAVGLGAGVVVEKVAREAARRRRELRVCGTLTVVVEGETEHVADRQARRVSPTELREKPLCVAPSGCAGVFGVTAEVVEESLASALMEAVKRDDDPAMIPDVVRVVLEKLFELPEQVRAGVPSFNAPSQVVDGRGVGDDPR